MLQWNPNSPNELPPSAEVLIHREAIVKKNTDARFEKYLRRRNAWMAAGKVALTASLFVDAHVAAYLGDVRTNMLEYADASASVEIIKEAINPENAHKATIFVHGFNTLGAESLARKLGPGYQESFDSTLVSVEYNNAPLDVDDITISINEIVAEEGFDVVDFVFYSYGDGPGTEAAAQIITPEAIVDSYVKKTPVYTENITILSGPAHFSTLTEKTKEELALAKSLAGIPYIEDSTVARIALEAYFYRKNIQRNFWPAVNGIAHRYENGNMTTNKFLDSQIRMASTADIPENILEIGNKTANAHRPNINYIKINDNKDTVVDNNASAKEICDAADEVNLHCTIVGVNSSHGDFYLPQSVQEYTKAFAELAKITKPYTAQEELRQEINSRLYYPDEKGSTSIDALPQDDEKE